MIEQSLEPKWNEDLELRGTFGELCGSLKVALFDKDPIKWSDGLGEVTVDLVALKKRSTLKFPKQQLSTQGVVSFTVSWIKDRPPPPPPVADASDDGRSSEEGVLRIRLEKASGLLAADSNGSSDPFAEVSVG